MVTFWTSLIPFRVWVSLTMTQLVCVAASVEGRITRTFLDSGSVEIALRRGVGQCGEIATGVVRLDRTILQLLLLGRLERTKGGTMALRGETLCLGPKMCRPRLVGSLKWCLREDRLVLGVGHRPRPRILLRHLKTCPGRSNFFRQSCLRRTSPSVRRWCCLLQERNGPRNESSCSGRGSNLETDCRSKRRVTLSRLLSLKLMQQSNVLCFKVCGNSLRL